MRREILTATVSENAAAADSPTAGMLERMRANHANLVQRLRQAPAPVLISRENVRAARRARGKTESGADSDSAFSAGGGAGNSVSATTDEEGSDDENVLSRRVRRRSSSDRFSSASRRRHAKQYGGAVVAVEPGSSAPPSDLALAARATLTGFDQIYSSSGDDRSESGSEVGESRMLLRYSASRERESVRRLERERDDALRREEDLRRKNGVLASEADDERNSAKRTDERERAVEHRANEAQLAFAKERMTHQRQQYEAREARNLVDAALVNARAESERVAAEARGAVGALESERALRATVEQSVANLRVELSRVSAERDASKEQESTLQVRVGHAASESREQRQRAEQLAQRVVKEEGAREQLEAEAARLKEQLEQDAAHASQAVERFEAAAAARGRAAAESVERLSTLEVEHSALAERHKPLQRQHDALQQKYDAREREAEAKVSAHRKSVQRLRVELASALDAETKRCEAEAKAAIAKATAKLGEVEHQATEHAHARRTLQLAAEASSAAQAQLTVEKNQSLQRVAMLQQRIEEVEQQLAGTSTARATAREDARRYRELCHVLEQQSAERAKAGADSEVALATAHATKVATLESVHKSLRSSAGDLEARNAALAAELAERDTLLAAAADDIAAERARAAELDAALAGERDAHVSTSSAHAESVAAHAHAHRARHGLAQLLATFAADGAARAAERWARGAAEAFDGVDPAQVSVFVFLFTVTFCTNPANNLTCPPHIF